MPLRLRASPPISNSTQATALNVRTAFVNQPIEVRVLRSQFESWLGLSGEHALLILRFGYGPDAPFSLRRPLDQVIEAEPREAASNSP